jgi:hypothetical protein
MMAGPSQLVTSTSSLSRLIEKAASNQKKLEKLKEKQARNLKKEADDSAESEEYALKQEVDHTTPYQIRPFCELSNILLLQHSTFSLASAKQHLKIFRCACVAQAAWQGRRAEVH